MEFFVPGIPSDESEAAYEALFTSAREQLRTPITPKRIYSLEYIHDKRPVKIRVGKPHPAHLRYTIVAIFESQPHIAMTQSTDGRPGPTIMIASHEITEVGEFNG